MAAETFPFEKAMLYLSMLKSVTLNCCLLILQTMMYVRESSILRLINSVSHKLAVRVQSILNSTCLISFHVQYQEEMFGCKQGESMKNVFNKFFLA